MHNFNVMYEKGKFQKYVALVWVISTFLVLLDMSSSLPPCVWQLFSKLAHVQNKTFQILPSLVKLSKGLILFYSHNFELDVFYSLTLISLSPLSAGLIWSNVLPVQVGLSYTGVPT